MSTIELPLEVRLGLRRGGFTSSLQRSRRGLRVLAGDEEGAGPPIANRDDFVKDYIETVAKYLKENDK